MTDYRRLYVKGAMWFFTVNLAYRYQSTLLVDEINLLRESFRYVKERHACTINAIVFMPEHLHCIWTLPDGDADYSTRWKLLKSYFSRGIPKGEHISHSRTKRQERGIWQRRFWAHLIISQKDFNSHVDYIHWNPVKHGQVKYACDWPYSSFHHYVSRGVYSKDWGHSGEFVIDGGE
ncbi:hypothetical protein AU255_02655 [Methyloprofundus sedimenti]|uniref:Transposase IS200-like domain-containing protein n=1 Tax=Methyloprofundus sedimenti TaxID=1420851 RepID=A0A1V8M5Z9_9GAMM|nr:transposase [Methyloprofundus sedimenti]OQK16823.1 hypothetical protein AU255_02655 [Methyloprofundus sedimenti]